MIKEKTMPSDWIENVKKDLDKEIPDEIVRGKIIKMMEKIRLQENPCSRQDFGLPEIPKSGTVSVAAQDGSKHEGQVCYSHFQIDVDTIDAPENLACVLVDKDQMTVLDENGETFMTIKISTPESYVEYNQFLSTEPYIRLRLGNQQVFFFQKKVPGVFPFVYKNRTIRGFIFNPVKTMPYGEGTLDGGGPGDPVPPVPQEYAHSHDLEVKPSGSLSKRHKLSGKRNRLGKIYEMEKIIENKIFEEDLTSDIDYETFREANWNNVNINFVPKEKPLSRLQMLMRTIRNSRRTRAATWAKRNIKATRQEMQEFNNILRTIAEEEAARPDAPPVDPEPGCSRIRKVIERNRKAFEEECKGKLDHSS